MHRFKKRYKLEYMIRNFSDLDREEVLKMIDREGVNYFHSLARDFLMNPDTKDIYTLSFIPANYKPENIEFTKNLYTSIFRYINEIFIRNKAYPVFENPEDLTSSELTRREIVKLYPERHLNDYFGTDAFRNYEPPIYEPENQE